ncbi:MAG: 50S ribosomal protein L1, partial [Gammaproteobacteria bacterium]|nr:50S ribosomal protein L1 [Gammaproteobacteria bacterium]
MAKLSKRLRAIKEKIEEGKLYPIDEAVTLLNELSS